MGAELSGLWRFDSTGFQHVELPPQFTEGPMNWLHADRMGRLWMARGVAGVARIDRPEADALVSARYTTRQGLSSNEVLCMTEDLSGNIYLGGARGVDRLDPGSGHVKHYTTSDGLAFGELQTAFRDSRGWLWFGTQRGLSRLIPSAAKARPATHARITRISVAGALVPVSPLGQEEVALPDLQPGHEQVQIEFVGLGFHAGETPGYQYLLEGAASGWSAPGAQRVVTYAGLRPGKYRFLVRALNSDGRVTGPASVRFTVLPPFWMQWWFFAALFAVCGSAAWLAWRYRQKQLAAVQGVRMRIAADLHDDIGASLSHIAMLSELARRDASKAQPERTGHLDQIAEVSRELVDSMSDIVWSTDPRRDHLGDLADRMRQYAGEVFGASNIEFRFTASAIEEGSKLSVNARREIFLVFKECLHNITRHSGSTKAWIHLRREGNALVMEAGDNGVGFDASRAIHGNGLRSMRARAENLGGEIEFVTGGQGTTVRLTAPL
jgi:signal transduction histidine kinase